MDLRTGFTSFTSLTSTARDGAESFKSTRYTKQGIRLKALDFSSRDVLVEAFQLGTPTGGSRCYCTVNGLAYDLNYHADLKRWRLGSLLTFNVAPPVYNPMPNSPF